MSVDIEIKQSGFFKKSLDLDFLKFLCENYGFSYGILNHAYALDDYQGGNDIVGTTFNVYNIKKIGRGFNFWIDSNRRDCFLRLNNPCTDSDISDFYDFISSACEKLKAKNFLQDGDVKMTEGIFQIRDDIMAWNRSVLREQIAANYKEWCIFGAVYPVYLEDSLISQIPYLNDRDMMNSYAEYLHDKQNKDHYYAKPIIYSDNSNNIFGRYAITEGVSSIFPLKPYITMGSGLDKETEVKNWSVSLGGFENSEYKTLGAVGFDDFVNNLNESANMFDAKHVIIELDKRDLNMLIEKSDKTD